MPPDSSDTPNDTSPESSRDNTGDTSSADGSKVSDASVGSTHRVGSDVPFYAIFAVIAATYVLLIAGLLIADATYVVTNKVVHSESFATGQGIFDITHGDVSFGDDHIGVAGARPADANDAARLSIAAASPEALMSTSLLLPANVDELAFRYRVDVASDDASLVVAAHGHDMLALPLTRDTDGKFIASDAIDLSGLADHTVVIEFRLTGHAANGAHVWIDNVKITGKTISPTRLDPAFRRDHPVLAWFLGNPIGMALLKPEIRYSIVLSLVSCTITAVLSLFFAVPIGYLMSRYKFPGRTFIDAVLDIPIVLPPLVVGLSLLILFQYAPDAWREAVVYQVPAVVIAQFMVACAFAVRTMRATFDQIDVRREQVALTLGCTRAQAFGYVVLPESGRGMLTAATLAWARSLGEFGPLLIFAGATRNKTEVLSTTVFLELSIGDLEAAVAVSLIMVFAAVVVLVIARVWGMRGIRI